ncbi:MAG: hypothetical protein J6K55_04425 [Clostridia bacterium]|nr:hypothetical protein [Clostridia bacterium]
MLKKLPLDDLLFGLIYLMGMIDSLVIRTSTVNALPHADTFGTCLQAAAIVLLIVKLCLDRSYTFASLMRMACVGILILIAFWQSRYNHVFYFLLIFLGIRNVNLPRLIRLDFIARIAIYALIILLFAFGIIENYVTYRTGDTTLRYSIGFSHPNVLASGVLILILTDAWLHRRQFSWLYAIVIWGISALLYVITSNRTSIALIVLFPVLLLPASTIRQNRPLSGFTSFCARWMLPAVIVFCIVFMLACGMSPVARTLDQLTSNRFTNSYNVYSNYGISLLGQDVTLTSVKAARLYNTPLALLDVAYLRMLLQAGPLIVLLFAFLYYGLTDILIKDNDRYTLLIVALFILYGIGESMFNNVFMNFTLIFAAKTFHLKDEIPSAETKV